MTRAPLARRLASTGLILVTGAYGAAGCGDGGRVAHDELARSLAGHTPAGLRLRVAILGAPTDPRVAPVREALAHCHGEFERLGRHVRFDAGPVRPARVPDAMLRTAGRGVWIGGGPATALVRDGLAGVSEDVGSALAGADLVSYVLPNTVRNVVAHELGHVLGRSHNGDTRTLMCGRPAPRRPAALASDLARFVPLTPAAERRVLARCP